MKDHEVEQLPKPGRDEPILPARDSLVVPTIKDLLRINPLLTKPVR